MYRCVLSFSGNKKLVVVRMSSRSQPDTVVHLPPQTRVQLRWKGSWYSGTVLYRWPNDPSFHKIRFDGDDGGWNRLKWKFTKGNQNITWRIEPRHPLIDPNHWIGVRVVDHNARHGVIDATQTYGAQSYFRIVFDHGDPPEWWTQHQVETAAKKVKTLTAARRT